MTMFDEPRILLALASLLAVALLVAIVGVLLARRKTRVLHAELGAFEAQLRATQDAVRRYEPEALVAPALRSELLGAQQAIGQLHAERGQLFAERGHLYGELQRYRALGDEEAALREVRGEIERSRQDGVALVRDIEVARQSGVEEIDRLQADIAALRRELGWFEREVYYESFGLYAPRYDFESSQIYKAKLESIRDRQRQMTRDARAAACSAEVLLDGSKKSGRKMVADYLRLMLRAFNGECDAAVAKVTAENANALADRMHKAFEAVNKLGALNHCSVSIEYLQLKLEELSLFHEYRLKKQEEREEQRAIQEQIREEKRALEELERARKLVEQDEVRFQQALAKARAEVDQTTGAKHDRMLQQITMLEAQLLDAQARQRAISQAELTRAGHVYVISNVGSFGEHIYKIGMTRRLDPMDRVVELGDASVPFPFDVHAIISTGDAPRLENELHRLFTQRRVNAVNHRKEFFSVTLEEIEAAVHRLHGHFEFTKAAEASEYRTSLATRGRAAIPQEPVVAAVVVSA